MLMIIIYQNTRPKPNRLNVVTSTLPSKVTFQIINGLLYHSGKVYVPNLPNVKQKNLHEYHDAPFVGHLGIHHTIDLISSKLFWKQNR